MIGLTPTVAPYSRHGLPLATRATPLVGVQPTDRQLHANGPRKKAKRGSWAKLLTHKESRGDMQGAALVKQASPVASQQVNLYKRYEFCKQPEPVDGDEIVRELPEIRIEPRPLWRRDLN